VRVLQVCAELFPLLKTGGLADVCGALPGALAKRGIDIRVLVPGFPAMLRGVPDARPVAVAVLVAGGLPVGVRLLRGSMPGNIDGNENGNGNGNIIPIYLIDAPLLFAREGNPYSDASVEE